jgi:hypothetical protein
VLAGYTGGGMSVPGNPGTGVIEPMPATVSGSDPTPKPVVGPVTFPMNATNTIAITAGASLQGRRRALQQAAAAPASFCRPYWWQEMLANGSSSYGYGGWRCALAGLHAALPAP